MTFVLSFWCYFLSLWLLAGVQVWHQGHSSCCTSPRSMVGIHPWNLYMSGINVYTFFVVPPHAICSGLWSIIATALFLVGPTADCNLHAAFEGLCYCILRLPPLVSDIMTWSFGVIWIQLVWQNYGERLLAQIIGALIMIVVGGGGAFITYFILYIVPIKPVTWCLER